jgi:hypothetical protein
VHRHAIHTSVASSNVSMSCFSSACIDCSFKVTRFQDNTNLRNYKHHN